MDTTFSRTPSINGAVTCLLVQPDNKIVLGSNGSDVDAIYELGGFGLGLARLNADGTLDQGFATGTATEQNTKAMVLQPDGKLIIAGPFFQYNSVDCKHIARINPDGSLDPSFDPGYGPDGDINAMVLQADGKVIIGGNFSLYDAQFIRRVARLNADGSLDPGFNPGRLISGTVNTVAVQPDGKVLVGGPFAPYNGGLHSNLARLNADGSLDSSFDPGDGFNANCLVMRADGKMYVGGVFIDVQGSPRNNLALLNTDGSVDPSFVPPATGPYDPKQIVLQPDGKLIVVGPSSRFTPRNFADESINRFNVDGSLDTTFTHGTGADDEVNVAGLQADGKVIIGGDFTRYNGAHRSGVARLNADGMLAHPVFFDGETSLANGVSYLAFQYPSFGLDFGYYSYLALSGYIYHFDLGYEYVLDAKDDRSGLYLYDFASSGFFYTSPSYPHTSFGNPLPFPYLYDFNLNSVVYYYPDPDNAGRYNTNGVRYFYVFSTGKIISK